MKLKQSFLKHQERLRGDKAAPAAFYEHQKQLETTFSPKFTSVEI